MVLRERIELSTSPLPMECSTTELPQQESGWAVGPVATGGFCHRGLRVSSVLALAGAGGAAYKRPGDFEPLIVGRWRGILSA